MHVGTRFEDLTPFVFGPHHEGVHGTFDMRLLFTAAAGIRFAATTAATASATTAAAAATATTATAAGGGVRSVATRTDDFRPEHFSWKREKRKRQEM